MYSRSVVTDMSMVKPGLALVMLGLLFGIGMGVGFGVNEDYFKDLIAQGIAAHPQVHDGNSAAKIWRYAQRAHFHATGIAAFSLALLVWVMFSSLKPQFKRLTAVLIGLSALYPLAWFTMFIKAPTIGRDAAHHHVITELLVTIGTGGLLLGIATLMANLFLGLLADDADV